MRDRGIEATDEARITEQVAAARVSQLYEMAIPLSLLGWVFSGLTLALLWSRMGQELLLAWFAARSAVALLRGLDAWQFRRSEPQPQYHRTWRQRYLVLLGLDGLTWGLMGWLFHAAGAPELTGIMLAAVIAIGTVSLFSIGHSFPANLLFSSLVFGPAALQQLMTGTSLSTYCGLGLLMFLGVINLESRRCTRRTIEHLRLRFEHEHLAEQRRVALENAKSDSLSKSRFVAVMSHEIRTPLNGILGMTQLLERSTLDAAQREQVDIVRRSGRHLVSLVNDILDLARIESGKLVVDAAPVLIREATDDVCRLLSPTAREKGLVFELRLAPTLPDCIMGDASRIKQVLHNLIGNAIKFTERGSIEVEVSTLRDTRFGHQLCFAVRDSGEGIEASQLERIFAPFEQVQGSSKPRTQEGTGLGLTISRELARAMGGDLRCSSTPGQGSTFEFTLPLQCCELSPEPPPPSFADSTLPELQGRVLLVDDAPVNLLVASAMLQQCGLTVDQAENGMAALDLLQAQRYDLVLMDCQMPELDGFAATARWRALEAQHGLTRTPVVALTASAVNGDRERCLASGMDDYLVKPFEMEDLVTVVTRHLETVATV